MKRLIPILFLLCLGTFSRAQEDVLSRILEVNTFSSLQASFTQVRHSSLMTENLESRGKVWLLAPDKVRWEVTAPFSKVTVFNGDIPSGRRFRLPSEKDFSASVVEGDGLSVVLVPLRRDLKQLFRQIVLTVDPETLLVRKALLVNPEGDWTSLSFSDVCPGVEIDMKLFEKQ